MKKLAIWALAAVFALGTVNVNAGLQDPNAKQKHEKQHKATHNKVTKGVGDAGKDVGKAGKDVGKEVGKGGKKVGKGAEEGAYDVSHNKATKKTGINQGNQKYSKDSREAKQQNKEVKKEEKKDNKSAKKDEKQDNKDMKKLKM